MPIVLCNHALGLTVILTKIVFYCAQSLAIVPWIQHRNISKSRQIFQYTLPIPCSDPCDKNWDCCYTVPPNLGTGLQDVLAKPLMELVKVLQLGGLERQVVCGQGNTGTHHSQLGLKVFHHVAQEVVAHGVEFFV